MVGEAEELVLFLLFAVSNYFFGVVCHFEELLSVIIFHEKLGERVVKWFQFQVEGIRDEVTETINLSLELFEFVKYSLENNHS